MSVLVVDIARTVASHSSQRAAVLVLQVAAVTKTAVGAVPKTAIGAVPKTAVGTVPKTAIGAVPKTSVSAVPKDICRCCHKDSCRCCPKDICQCCPKDICRCCSQRQLSVHTPSTAFRHLLPNSARFGYATEGTLFISAQLSTDAVSALRKVWVLIYMTVEAT